VAGLSARGSATNVIVVGWNVTIPAAKATLAGVAGGLAGAVAVCGLRDRQSV